MLRKRERRPDGCGEAVNAPKVDLFLLLVLRGMNLGPVGVGEAYYDDGEREIRVRLRPNVFSPRELQNLADQALKASEHLLREREGK